MLQRYKNDSTDYFPLVPKITPFFYAPMRYTRDHFFEVFEFMIGMDTVNIDDSLLQVGYSGRSKNITNFKT